MKRVLVSKAMALALAACATNALAQAEVAADADDPTIAKLPELLIALISSYTTSPDNSETIIVDRRSPIEVEGSEGFWFYSQLNTGPDQRVYRQRFHQLTVSEDGQVTQRSFVPVDANRFVDGWDNPEVFRSLSSEDMESALNSGCDQQWSVDAEGIWRGSVDPTTCAIFSERRQANVRIGADSFYSGRQFGTSERGFDDDMNPIWGSAPGEHIPLTRCASPFCSAEASALSQRSE